MWRSCLVTLTWSRTHKQCQIPYTWKCLLAASIQTWDAKLYWYSRETDLLFSKTLRFHPTPIYHCFFTNLLRYCTSFLGYLSLMASNRKEPIPLPVPPAMEWISTKPSLQIRMVSLLVGWDVDPTASLNQCPWNVQILSWGLKAYYDFNTQKQICTETNVTNLICFSVFSKRCFFMLLP